MWEFLKVIVGAHAVMANGGVIAPVGLNMVALAAQRHAVPFVVLAGSHKVILHNKRFNCTRSLMKDEQIRSFRLTIPEFLAFYLCLEVK